MEPTPRDTWTLEDLTAEAAQRLSALGILDAQSDRRVSASADARTVRYYTTLGLLDRPAIVGRQARYGPRHVWQLVAIKALQGLDLPLAEVQARLYGRGDDEIRSIVEAAAVALGGRQRETVRVLRWREVTIEPGIRLLVEEGWSPSGSIEPLMARLRTALESMRQQDLPHAPRNGSADQGEKS